MENNNKSKHSNNNSNKDNENGKNDSHENEKKYGNITAVIVIIIW